MQRLHSTVSTTTYNRAYLVKAWEHRSTLGEHERHGFAQFFYLTIASHVEACMGEIIERRLMYTRTLVREVRDQSFSWKKEGVEVSHSAAPLYSALRGVVEHFARKAEKAPLEPLSEYFQDLFGVKLPSLLGELHSDLKALASLRNVFAHGRSLWLEFEQSERNLVVLEQNPLQLPAQRLYAAGILKSLQIDGDDHHEFRTAFYSDPALLYFLDRAKRIETLFKGQLTFEPERDMPLMVSLPELQA